MELFLLYLWLQLNMFGILSFLALLLLGAVAIITGFMAWEEEDDQKLTSLALKSRRWALVFLIITIFLPSTKDAAILLAGYGVLEVAKTDTAKQMMSNSVKILEYHLEKYVKELPKKVEKEINK